VFRPGKRGYCGSGFLKGSEGVNIKAQNTGIHGKISSCIYSVNNNLRVHFNRLSILFCKARGISCNYDNSCQTRSGFSRFNSGITRKRWNIT